MKLYTEEEVKDAYLQGWYDGSIGMSYPDRREDAIELLTPIELPSDEEVRNISKGEYYDEEQRGFISGAKWMKEQILKQKQITNKTK